MIKIEIDGIEIISNRDKEEHKELCSIINEYIDEIFKDIPREEVVKWIKKFDFTQECIDSEKGIKGYYDLEDKLIMIVNENKSYINLIIYHEITHVRIYYEDRNNHIKIPKYWDLINEYKTKILTCTYFIDDCIKYNLEDKLNSIFEFIISDLLDNLEKIKKRFDRNEDLDISTSEVHELWYISACMASNLYLIDKYREYLPLKVVEIFEPFKELKYVQPILKICNCKYEISNLEVNYLMSTLDLV